MHVGLDALQMMGVAGALLLAMALSSAQLRRLPISTAAVYLAIGIALSPTCLNWLSLNVTHEAAWLERTTEIALTISLFVGGLKLREPLTSRAWSVALRLAFPLLLATIVAIALLAQGICGLGMPAALLLAAILAPTDPVLAGAVSVSDAADRDRVRYGLAGEAGLNDGLAFPFVHLALAWHGGEERATSLLGILARAVLWSIPAGLAVGFVLGLAIGRCAVWLRSHHRDTHAPSDFLALALVSLSYFAAQSIGALGFLAAFAAGVGLRRAELKVVRDNPHPVAREQLESGRGERFHHPPAEHLVQAHVTDEAIQEPAVAAGVLVAETISFGDTAERLLEVLLVILVGVSAVSAWTLRGLLLSLCVFFVLRPLLTQAVLTGSVTTRGQRWLLGWFGVRGIGSLYYLSYALNRGLPQQLGTQLTHITLTVLAASIVLHGITAQPLLSRYEQLRRSRAQRRSRGDGRDSAQNLNDFAK